MSLLPRFRHHTCAVLSKAGVHTGGAACGTTRSPACELNLPGKASSAKTVESSQLNQIGPAADSAARRQPLSAWVKPTGVNPATPALMRRRQTNWRPAKSRPTCRSRENLHTECDICLPAIGEAGPYLLPISEQSHQILLGAAVGCSIALHASHGDSLTVTSARTALQSGVGAGLIHSQLLSVRTIG